MDVLVLQLRARTLVRVGCFSLALLLLGGCASAGKRFEQGQRLEQQGRYAEAARHYISSLKREPGWEAARYRLREAGDHAVAGYLREAAAADSAGRATDAADRLLEAEALRRESAEVGVHLAVPDDHEESRRVLLGKAVEVALERGRDAVRRQSWNDALLLYARAAERYQPTPDQGTELDRAHFEALLAWSENELERNRFRAAHERVEQALSILSAGPADRERAERVRTIALERGTRRIAIVPIQATDRVLRQISGDLIPELNDQLELDHWSDPPLFLDVIPAAEVGRELRRQNLSRRVLSTSEAASVGRRLGSHFVVVAEVDSAFRTETDVRTTRRPVRTQAGVDTAFTIEQGRQRVMARVAFAIIDPDARRSVDSGTASATATTSFRRGRYAGDPRTLNLSRADRDLFEADARNESEREAVRSLVDDLSARLSRAVYERLMRRVN